jgi:hypothetical protein
MFALAETWEGLGVWPGATVTGVECTGYKINTNNPDLLTAELNIFQPDGLTVSPLASYTGTLPGPTGWVDGAGLLGQQVVASAASSGPANLDIEVYTEFVGDVAIKFDSIALAITFNGGTPPGPVVTPSKGRRVGRWLIPLPRVDSPVGDWIRQREDDEELFILGQ